VAAGELLDRQELPTEISGAQAWRIRYQTYDVVGQEHECSGIVIAPTGNTANRPVVTWCHGTTGLGDSGCPSAQPDPVRELTVYFSQSATQEIDYGIPGLQGFIDAGFIVCATDYQGLGTPGVHQYVVNRSNARDAVTIVHAARSMGIGAGKQVASIGWSQGGGASAAVAELGDDEFGDLDLVGSVLLSPGVPYIGLSVPSGPTAALTNREIAPDSHLLMLMMGFASAYSNLSLSDVLTPLGEQLMNRAWNTQPVHHLNDTIARTFAFEGAILSTHPLSLPEWEAAVKAGSAAQRKPRCPLLLCVDGFGNGTVVPVAWQQGYANAVEALGGKLEIKEYPEADHFALPYDSETDALSWIKARLRAVPQMGGH